MLKTALHVYRGSRTRCNCSTYTCCSPTSPKCGPQSALGDFSCIALLLLSLTLPALAVLSDTEDTRPALNDPDYTAGLAALQRADWQGVLDSMGRVVARRPWDDGAYNLLGFASRKLGNYSQALVYYHKALDLNPHHRGALEYLGEAYLEMRCVAQARDVLTRLEAACKRITGHTT